MTQEPADEYDAVRQSWTPATGARLRAMRRSRGLLQAQVASKVEVARSVLSNWENGLRKPAAAQVVALCRALDLQPADFALQRAPIAATETSRVAQFLDERASDYVTPDQREYTVRFLRQLRTFERLANDAELSAKRWADTRAAADEQREQALAPSRPQEETRRRSASIGRTLARRMRKHLDLSDAPLPPVEATADLLGVSIFLIHLAPTPHGRLRGLLVESPKLGAVLLLNASLTVDSRRLVLTECVAQAVLQPAGGVVAAVTSRDERNDFVHIAARTFAVEFALPGEALTTNLAVDLDLASRRHAEAPDEAVASAVAEISTLFGVSPSHITARGQLQVTERQRQLIARNLDLYRTLSSSTHRDRDRSWSTTAEDLPRRFLQHLLRAVVEGRATTSGVSDLTGVAAPELDELLRVLTAGDRTEGELSSSDDVEWFDSWHFDQVA